MKSSPIGCSLERMKTGKSQSKGKKPKTCWNEFFKISTNDFKAGGWLRSSSNSRDPVGQTPLPLHSGKSHPWTPSNCLHFPSSEMTFPRHWTSCMTSCSHWMDIGEWLEPPPSSTLRRGLGWKRWGPWKPGGGRCPRWWWKSRTGSLWCPQHTGWTTPVYVG